MKIAVISSLAASLINFRGPLLTEIVRRGHQVLAFAPDHSEETRQTLLNMGIMPIEFGMTRSGMNFLSEIKAVWELYRLMQYHQPELCFSYFIKPVIYGTIAARAAGVKHRVGLIEGLGFSFTQTSANSFRRKILQKIIILLARFSMKGVDRLIFLNTDDLDELVASRVIETHKTAVLGGIGVDLSDWAQAPLLDGAPTFILVARLLRDKGIADYISAARIIRLSYPETRFILLGGLDDNPAAVSQTEVEAWVNEGLIIWPGHVPVKPWLKKSHIFVLPSYREGVPRSTQEAMALGRPVITTDVPGCRETVVNGQNGFLVPVRTPDALATAMRRFLDDPTLIAKMGNESRRMAEEWFDVHKQNEKLLGLLRL